MSFEIPENIKLYIEHAIENASLKNISEIKINKIDFIKIRNFSKNTIKSVIKQELEPNLLQSMVVILALCQMAKREKAANYWQHVSSVFGIDKKRIFRVARDIFDFVSRRVDIGLIRNGKRIEVKKTITNLVTRKNSTMLCPTSADFTKHEELKHNKKFKSGQFKLDGKQLVLQIPEQKVIRTYLHEEFTITLREKETEVCSKKVKTLTMNNKFNLNKFYNNLNYEINSVMAGVIFSSAKKLNRNAIIFDSNGNEIRGEKLSVQFIRVLIDKDSQFACNTEFEYNEHNNWAIYSLFLKPYSYFYVDGCLYTPDTETYKSGLSKKNKCENFELKHNDENYGIFCQVPYFVLKVKAWMISRIVVDINGITKGLNDLCIVEYLTKGDGSGETFIKCKFKAEFILEGQLIDLVIGLIGRKQKLIKQKFIFLVGLKIEFNKEFFFGYEELEIKDINSSNGLVKHVNKQALTSIVDENLQSSCLVLINKKICELKFYVPGLSSKLGDILLLDVGTKIWHEKLKNNLVLTINSTQGKPEIYIAGETLELVKSRASKSPFSYKLKDKLPNKTNGDVKIIVETPGISDRIEIAEIIFLPKVEFVYFNYITEKSSFECMYTYYGNSELYITLKKKADGFVLFEERLETNIFGICIKLEPDKYTVCIIEISQHKFTGKQITNCLWEEELIVGTVEKKN